MNWQANYTCVYFLALSFWYDTMFSFKGVATDCWSTSVRTGTYAWLVERKQEINLEQQAPICFYCNDSVSIDI